MKSAKNVLFLFLTWIISLLALCLSFIFYSKEGLTFQKIAGGTFLLMIYSAIFSLPAFIFFLVTSVFTLRSSKLNVIQKKLIMVSANLLDILITFGALFLLVASDTFNNGSVKSLPSLNNILSFYPVWVLAVVSSLLIVLFPFNFNQPIKNIGYEKN